MVAFSLRPKKSARLRKKAAISLEDRFLCRHFHDLASQKWGRLLQVANIVLRIGRALLYAINKNIWSLGMKTTAQVVIATAFFGCVVGSLAGTAKCDVVAVFNPSFESDILPPRGIRLNAPVGWSVDDPNGILDGSNDSVGVLAPIGTSFYNSIPNGNNVALIYLAGDIEGGQVSLRQVLSETLQPNRYYELKVGVGNIASGFAPPPSNQFFNLAGFPGYRIQLRAGNQILAEDNNSLFGQIPEGEFRESTIGVSVSLGHSQIGQPLAIWLTNKNQRDVPNPGIEVNFDHVRLNATTVPEPATGLIIGLGGACLLFWRRVQY